MLFLGEASHIDFVHEKRHVDVGGGGGGRWIGPCDVSRWKTLESLDSLLTIFNILKSSIQNIQNPAFL